MAKIELHSGGSIVTVRDPLTHSCRTYCHYGVWHEDPRKQWANEEGGKNQASDILDAGIPKRHPLATWRKQRNEAILTALSSRRPAPPPHLSSEAAALVALWAKNERPIRQLDAESVIATPKNVSSILA